MHLYTKTKRGIEYFYLRETKWKNGKTVCSFQKYIGNKEKLFEVIQNGLNPGGQILQPTDSRVYSYGAVASLVALTKKTGLQDILDKHMQKRNQDMPISLYLVIAAINRAISAKSKNSIANWANSTSLPFLLKGLSTEKLTSQSFWNHMDLVTEEQIHAAENEITETVAAQYQLKLDSLLYDSTNYYSYIHTFNKKPSIEQRGKNKQKRADLRQANLALLVTQDHHIPLFHKVYDGNTNDYTGFKETVSALKEKIDLLGKSEEGLTLVFDSGNVSEDSMKLINNFNLKFISKLKPSEHKDLLRIELKNYEKLNDPKFEGIKIYTTKKRLYGSEKLVVIKFNEDHYNAEYATLLSQIEKTSKELSVLSARLENYQHTKQLPSNVTPETVGNLVMKIFKGRTVLKKIIEYKIEQKDGFPLLTWKQEPQKLAEFVSTYLGKTIYFTNKTSLTARQVMEIYSYQYKIEKLFKISKNRKGGCWWPKYHWTDQKIKVHAFYCFLSLLLLSLLELETAKLGIKSEPHNLIEELCNVYEIIDRYENKKANSLVYKRHSFLNPIQQKIFDHFELEKYFKR